ncbi:MAG: metallophosphoesterase family protein [Pseudomonadota bacterium]
MEVRIGVLSDTHLHRVSKDLLDIYNHYLKDMDIIFHAGDFVSHEIVNFFSNKKDFHGVSGNMDPFDVKTMVPEKKVVDIGAFKLGLIHGWGSLEGLEERIRSEFQNVDIIVYGHSHSAANHMRDGILFFNPGTAIGYSSSHVHSIGVLEISDAVDGKIINIEFPKR